MWPVTPLGWVLYVGSIAAAIGFLLWADYKDWL